MKVQYATEYSVHQQCVNFWIIRGDNKVARLQWEYSPRGVYVEPTSQLTDMQAQDLMDQLWSCGFRPTEGRGSAGALAAVQRHLDDFRAIVSNTLQVTFPNDNQ